MRAIYLGHPVQANAMSDLHLHMLYEYTLKHGIINYSYIIKNQREPLVSQTIHKHSRLSREAVKLNLFYTHNSQYLIQQSCKMFPN